MSRTTRNRRKRRKRKRNRNCTLFGPVPRRVRRYFAFNKFDWLPMPLTEPVAIDYSPVWHRNDFMPIVISPRSIYISTID